MLLHGITYVHCAWVQPAQSETAHEAPSLMESSLAINSIYVAATVAAELQLVVAATATCAAMLE